MSCPVYQYTSVNLPWSPLDVYITNMDLLRLADVFCGDAIVAAMKTQGWLRRADK